MELPSLTVAPEDVDVQLLKEVHDEGVDLRQQPHEEDDGEAESEDCGGDTQARKRMERGIQVTRKIPTRASVGGGGRLTDDQVPGRGQHQRAGERDAVEAEA